MDKLEGIKKSYEDYSLFESTVGDDIDWLISEIERVRELVKQAYAEGGNDCDEMRDEKRFEAWEDSRSKEELQVIKR